MLQGGGEDRVKSDPSPEEPIAKTPRCRREGDDQSHGAQDQCQSFRPERATFRPSIESQQFEIVIPWLLMAATFRALEVEEVSSDTLEDGLRFLEKYAEAEHGYEEPAAD